MEWRSLWDRTWLLPSTNYDFGAAEKLDLALDRIEDCLLAAGLGARDAWGLVTDPASGRVEAVLLAGGTPLSPPD